MTQTQESTTAAAAVATAALPPPPRAITPLARRRAWGDIHVRFWWLSALGVILVTAYFTAWRVSDALRDRAIIREGQVVQTTITSVDGGRTPGYAVLRHERIQVTLSGQTPDGQTMEFAGQLPVAAGYAKVGQPLTIRVDPDDPTRWTDRTEVVPWTQELALSLMFVPVIAALLIVAWLMRRRVVAVWRDGNVAAGEVVELRTYAMAPLSRRVKYKLAESSERRLFSALWPNRAGPIAVGQRVALLVDPRNTGRSILAHLYDAGAAPSSAPPVPPSTADARR